MGKDLDQIAEIDLKGAKLFLEGVSLTVMCDIDNPLYGPIGAAYVFGPQKGQMKKWSPFWTGRLWH